MADGKISVPDGEEAPASQIGATLEALAATIADRRDAGEESYTHRLLAGSPDKVLKKVMEEAGEVALAAKDVEAWATSSIAAAVAFESACAAESAAAAETPASVEAAAAADCAFDPDELAVQLPPEYDAAIDHLRYEAADVVYHLMVVLERYGISLDEFAAELNTRMTAAERPKGAVCLRPEHVKRGK
ncbi:phosphoribosyl-ATP diphosphatase [Xiamenia xianingshaonis]|uniref:Phosphoribosyl-ATP pyrophosphatase n=1 Tax=Xiamenia xianingshaonis TaxID=2682776 RepID=A0A9E6MQP9_9ACTN|nr:phosphoribosyl-ATP diphosphatase [Xiamenia xianingshaonis]NHM13284.1 phosphoribosyl-ATP diphosphatase [Xiamenia xianingshaonis]QTU84632.1 phosphoribosyl-ATP diphosphatase [Xiamenia xianingshaonis]